MVSTRLERTYARNKQKTMEPGNHGLCKNCNRIQKNHCFIYASHALTPHAFGDSAREPTNQPSSFWYLPYHALHLGLQRSFLRRRTQPSEVVKLSIGDRGQNLRRSLVPGPWSSMFGLMRQKCLSGEKFYWSLICRHPVQQPAASVENRDHF